MLTLYDYLPSQNGWKVRVLLGLLQISYHSRLVSIFEGESRSEAFLNLNPAGAQREHGGCKARRRSPHSRRLRP